MSNHAHHAHGLRIATNCISVAQFIETTYRFCEGSTIFIPTIPRPVGTEISFSFDLVDFRVVLEGVGIVREAFATGDNRFARRGILVDVTEWTAASRNVFKQMIAVRAADRHARSDELDESDEKVTQVHGSTADEALTGVRASTAETVTGVRASTAETVTGVSATTAGEAPTGVRASTADEMATRVRATPLEPSAAQSWDEAVVIEGRSFVQPAARAETSDLVNDAATTPSSARLDRALDAMASEFENEAATVTTPPPEIVHQTRVSTQLAAASLPSVAPRRATPPLGFPVQSKPLIGSAPIVSAPAADNNAREDKQAENTSNHGMDADDTSTTDVTEREP